MEYKNSKEMTVKEPGQFRSGPRWKGHLRGEKTGRMMWMRKGKPVKRNERYGGELMGLEVEIHRIEKEKELSYDDITGGHQSSFALVEMAVRLYGRNPDHYNNASYEELFVEKKDDKK